MRFVVSALSVAAVLVLSACGDKPSNTTATDTPAPETPVTNTAPADPAMPADINNMIIQSPYMDFVVKTNRAAIISHIKSDTQLTPEQAACLQSVEGNTTYLAILDPYVKEVLSADDIKEADEFFGTEAGRKFGEMALNELGAENMPPFIEPNDSEKAEIANAMLKPFFVKMKAKNDAASMQEAIDFMMTMVKKEKERCKIF